MEFIKLEDGEAAEIKYDQDIITVGQDQDLVVQEFSNGDIVEVTFLAEVSNYNPDTNEYEVILPYNFLQGRYNHAYFPRDSIDGYIEPYEDGAVYRDPGSGDLYYRFGEHWLSFGSDAKFDDVVFGWDTPEKIIDSNGDFV